MQVIFTTWQAQRTKTSSYIISTNNLKLWFLSLILQSKTSLKTWTTKVCWNHYMYTFRWYQVVGSTQWSNHNRIFIKRSVEYSYSHFEYPSPTLSKTQYLEPLSKGKHVNMFDDLIPWIGLPKWDIISLSMALSMIYRKQN